MAACHAAFPSHAEPAVDGLDGVRDDGSRSRGREPTAGAGSPLEPNAAGNASGGRADNRGAGPTARATGCGRRRDRDGEAALALDGLCRAGGLPEEGGALITGLDNSWHEASACITPMATSCRRSLRSSSHISPLACAARMNVSSCQNNFLARGSGPRFSSTRVLVMGSTGVKSASGGGGRRDCSSPIEVLWPIASAIGADVARGGGLCLLVGQPLLLLRCALPATREPRALRAITAFCGQCLREGYRPMVYVHSSASILHAAGPGEATCCRPWKYGNRLEALTNYCMTVFTDTEYNSIIPIPGPNANVPYDTIRGTCSELQCKSALYHSSGVYYYSIIITRIYPCRYLVVVRHHLVSATLYM